MQYSKKNQVLQKLDYLDKRNQMSNVILRNWNDPLFGGMGTNGIHQEFLGDPTLRDHVFLGVENLMANAVAGKVNITWQDSQPDVEGFYVYVSADKYSGYRLVNEDILTDKSVTISTISGDLYVMLRSVKTTNTIGGVFKNLGAGQIKEIL
jgi:hypothetical protein